MKKRIIPITLLTALLIVGCTFGGSSSDSTSEESTTSETTSETSEETSESNITVTLNYTENSIAINQDFKLVATVENATNTRVTWSSTDENIAYVSKYGVVYGLKDGVATIKATSNEDRNAYATCEVTVTAVQTESITLDITSKDMHVNDSFTITYTVTPSDASYKGVNFASEDESIAKVDSKGKVTATGMGETDIVVSNIRYPEVFAKCHINVLETPLEGIKLAKTSAEMHPGDTFALVTRFTPTNATNKNVTYISNDESIASVDGSGVVTANAIGTARITVTSVDGGFTDTFEAIVKDPSEIAKSTMPYDYLDYMSNNLYNLDATPNESANLLIVPVWFTDSGSYVKKKDEVRRDIEKAYLGTNEQTGWRSVKTYYEELSGGLLTLTGTVTPWYETGKKASAYADDSSGMSETIELVSDVCDWYMKENNLSSMSNFDADSNGYLDGVILIYGAPDYSAWGQSSDSYGNLWAYTYWLQKTSNNNLANPGPNVFFWASYDFMYGTNKALFSKYFGGDTSNCSIDAHTYIHESGHMFGLEDYYDYGSNGYKAAGGFSMQDYNVGSHDPYSVMALGWSNPYVVEGNATLTIGTFQETKDLILVTPEFHNSPFDEYILVELYSPTGLNEFDTLHKYENNYPQGANKVGVRLWHVDARLVYGRGYSDASSGKNVTYNPTIEGYSVYHMFSNSSGDRGSILGRNYDKYNLLELIRNDVNETYNSKNVFAADDLFLQGDTFTLSKYTKQFANNGKLNSGLEFNFTISFDEMTTSSATISITRA